MNLDRRQQRAIRNHAAGRATRSDRRVLRKLLHKAGRLPQHQVFGNQRVNEVRVYPKGYTGERRTRKNSPDQLAQQAWDKAVREVLDGLG